MKYLVTHLRPHLDDIAGIWLFKKFHPEFHDAKIAFIPITIGGKVTFQDEPVDSNPDVIHIGVARGKFDEHALEKPTGEESAATMVFDHLKAEGHIPEDEIQKQALEQLIHYVMLEDTARTKGRDLARYTAHAIIQGMNLDDKDDEEASHEMYQLGAQILESLFFAEQDITQLDHDWKSREDFETPWGKATALTTTSHGADEYAYRHGYTIIVLVDPERNYRQIRANRDSEVDLTDVFHKLEKQDPEAEWYLHQSKKLLICGHHSAPTIRPSSMPIEDLVKLVQK